MIERNPLFSLDFVEIDQLTPLEQFRDWIERPDNLNLWMRYPQDLDDSTTMREQIDRVLNQPDEASPKVIFNLALKDAELCHFDGGDSIWNIPNGILTAYQRGLTSLSRCNKFSMQEHWHYWQALTTLLSNQNIAVQTAERNMEIRARGRKGNGRR